MVAAGLCCLLCGDASLAAPSIAKGFALPLMLVALRNIPWHYSRALTTCRTLATTQSSQLGYALPTPEDHVSHQPTLQIPVIPVILVSRDRL